VATIPLLHTAAPLDNGLDAAGATASGIIAGDNALLAASLSDGGDDGVSYAVLVRAT
jgi:hypothetical protein